MRNHLHQTARHLTALGLAVAATATPGIASATPPDESGVVTRAAYPDARVYAEDGVIVITGPEFQQGCLGLGFAQPVTSFINRPDGTEISHYHVTDQIQVFEGGDPFALIDAACGAIFDGDPSTAPPQPIAVGEGRVQHRQSVSPDGIVDGHNSVTGHVTTLIGDRVRVNAFAQFTQSADGTVLHQLRVNYGG